MLVDGSHVFVGHLLDVGLGDAEIVFGQFAILLKLLGRFHRLAATGAHSNSGILGQRLDRLGQIATTLDTIDSTAFALLAGGTAFTGDVSTSNGSAGSGLLKILEDTDSGVNFASFQVPALAADTVYTLPTTDGNANEFLLTDGSGGLSWSGIVSGTVASTEIADAACIQSFALTFNPTEAIGTTDYVAITAIDVATGDASFSATETAEDNFITSFTRVANSLAVVVDVAPDNGAGSQSWAVLLRDDAGGTSLTCTITEAQTTCTDVANRPTVASGSRLNFRVVSTDGTNAPVATAEMTISFCLGN